MPQYVEKIFVTTGKPCGEDRIAEIEERIGFKLPDTYKKVIMECGGGALDPDAGLLREDEELGSEVAELYGNGQPTDEHDEYSLDDVAKRMMDTWEMPKWGFLIGVAEGDIHTPILLNLSNPSYPVNGIVCVDLESEEEVLIADSFDDLWDQIRENAEVD